MGTKGRLFFVAVLAVFSISNSWAGTSLFLKAGTVETQTPPAEVKSKKKKSSKSKKSDVTKSSAIDSNSNKKDSSSLQNLLEIKDAVLDQIPIALNTDLVVQLDAPITTATVESLEQLGLRIHSYLPDDALIVSGQPHVRMIRRMMSAQKDLGIRFVTEYQPDWKLSSELSTGNSVFNQDELVKLHIRFLSNAYTSTAKAWIQSCETCRVQSWGAKRIIAEVPRKLIAALSQVTGIEFIEPYRAPETMEFVSDRTDLNSTLALRGDYTDLTGYESGTLLMKAPQAYAKGFKGQGQVVAIADGGLDTGSPFDLHPDFPNFQAGFFYGSGRINWKDTGGHGTHVAGSAVGQGTLSGGRIQGTAPESKLIVASIADSGIGTNQGLDVPAEVETFIGEPYDNGARIHSNSWGTSNAQGLYTNYSAEMDEFSFAHPDILLVFAASNAGCDADRDGRIDEGSVAPPGTAKNVLTVGASKNLINEGGNQTVLGRSRNRTWMACYSAEPLASTRLSDDPKGLAPFSSRGPTRDGRLKPEVVAPGTNIVSVRSRALQRNIGEVEMAGRYNQSYLFAGGTSMATPLVAGAAAIVRQNLIQERGQTLPSAALIKAVLMHTAEDLYPGQFPEGPQQELPTRRPNVHLGFGRIDLDRATTAAAYQILDDKNGVATGETGPTLSVNVEANGYLMATMTYSDSPAAASSARALVNDLSLEIQTPTGEVIEKRDGINNTQVYEMSGLAAGTYNVRVKGHRVPRGRFGKQGYALVVTGR